MRMECGCGLRCVHTDTSVQLILDPRNHVCTTRLLTKQTDSALMLYTTVCGCCWLSFMCYASVELPRARTRATFVMNRLQPEYTYARNHGHWQLCSLPSSVGTTCE